MKFFSILLVSVIAYAGYVAYPILRAVYIDRTLVPNAHPFSLNDPTRERHILVLGDSTAVGVGTNPQETIAGRLAEILDASVENYAKSGALTENLAGQISLAKRDSYDLVVMQIGANDILGMHSLEKAEMNLDSALSSLKSKSKHIVFLTAGDLKTTPMLRWPLNLLMSHRSKVLREKFMREAEMHGAVYIDLFTEPDIFSSDPKRYHAKDGLHLTGEGYGYWFELIQKALQKWPELSTHTRQ